LNFKSPGVTGYVWDIYETSVKMSSYLVAAMVSEFVGIPAEISPSGVEFRIWARADARNLTVYYFELNSCLTILAVMM